MLLLTRCLYLPINLLATVITTLLRLSKPETIMMLFKTSHISSRTRYACKPGAFSVLFQSRTVVCSSNVSFDVRMRKIAVLVAVLLTCVSSCDITTKNPFPMPDCYGFRLEEADIDAIQRTLQSGRLSSRQVVHCYVERVNKVNPYLR